MSREAQGRYMRHLINSLFEGFRPLSLSQYATLVAKLDDKRTNA